ncbi:glycosyltransferase [Nocardioides campestrisoli]|uniref:glycosyltransferase n=1 Tax=Nocardioides campestrisoli TaxID=2736757 RepID=UPI00163DB2B3|nr:nucleotide disphospho-sugar-binding domain-containing protein [Nocardioides campestrisoli]
MTDPSGFLFVVPPFTGHVNPTVPVAADLVARGHRVAWTGVPGTVEHLLPFDAVFLPATSSEVTSYAADMGARRSDLRGAAAFKFLQEEVLLPLGDAMVDGVDAAVEAFGADVLVVDQQALAGAVVGRRRGLPWATSATTSAELVDPLSGLPRVAEAMHRRRVELQVAHGIAPEAAEAGDLRVSEHLLLAYTAAELVGPLAIDSPVTFVGPSLGDRPEEDDFPWDTLDADRPTVLVSLGTLNAEAGTRFWQVAADACRDQPWQAVFVAPPSLVPDRPANVVVRPRVPQLALLQRVDAVVSHAGHNTVCESLAAGLPLVLAPIRDDQPVVADQVVQAGAGVRVRFARVRAEELRSAISTALTDEGLRAAATGIAKSFASAGGAAAAASALVELARP